MITPKLVCKLRVLVEVVEDDLAHLHRAFRSMAIRIPSRSDSSRMSENAFDRLLAHELGDPFDQGAPCSH
jgi:hypothetical protein